MRRILSVLLENESGALSRVIGLFAQRGYNIESLTVAPTDDPTLSRMTIQTVGDAKVLEQIEKQLNKLIDVKEIVELPAHESVCRELVMIKVECGPEKRQQVSSIADIFRANIVDVSKESMIIALTGSLSKMNAFIELLEDFNITEVARTGITGLARGSADLKKM